jgi:hypothetical protein
MENLDRYRQPRQLLFFEKEPALPSWEALPDDTRDQVCSLLTMMLQDHSLRLLWTNKSGGEIDE